MPASSSGCDGGSWFAADHEEGARRFAAERGWAGPSSADVLAMPAVFVGTVEGIAAEVVERRARFGFSSYAVSDADLARTVPILERLAGA